MPTNEYYEDAEMAGPPPMAAPEDGAPMEEPAAPGQGQAMSAVIPKAVLGDQPVQVGDTITLQVTAVKGEEVEVTAAEPGPEAEPETSPEMEEMMA